ncbi:MAG: Abortive phage infection protein [Haloplasmataceae bacterium]|nr:Abortive phage infection protein [Haloplasmataceae bacterium]
MQVLSFNVKSYRRLDNPNRGAIETYEFYVPIASICDNIPIVYNNHRLQGSNTETQREIEDSLLDENNEIFHILNRGLVLSAAKINYYKDREIVVITLCDELLHGNIDGGRTYLSILRLLKNRNNLEKLQNKFVKMEVLIGLDYKFYNIAHFL